MNAADVQEVVDALSKQFKTLFSADGLEQLSSMTEEEFRAKFLEAAEVPAVAESSATPLPVEQNKPPLPNRVYLGHRRERR